MEKFVIFSIDGVNDTHKQAKFLRHIDTARAMGRMRGRMVHCIGSYKGEIEPSYLMMWADFQEHVIGRGFTEKQESILMVSECNKQYATLVFSDQSRQSIGSLKSVGKDEAMKHEAWTYRPDLNTYWIAVNGNPDTVHGVNTVETTSKRLNKMSWKHEYLDRANRVAILPNKSLAFQQQWDALEDDIRGKLALWQCADLFDFVSEIPCQGSMVILQMLPYDLPSAESTKT